MEYKIIIDQQVVDEYNAAYFKLHPRARKKPIEKPTPVSLNQILIMRRPQVADLKTKWGDFGKWLVNKYGYNDLKLDKFELEATVYLKTHHRADIDNHCLGGLKLLLDAFTQSGMIYDDDYLHLTKMICSMGYSKENPRTELTFRIIEEDMVK